MRRLLLIYNSSAGSADDDARGAVLAALREYGDVAEELAADPGDLPDILGRHPERSPVIAGGDGALHCLVAALVEREELARRAVGLIPLGTGNDLARALGLPLDAAAAAKVVGAGWERPMDLLVDDAGGIAVNAVHLGVGAEASRAATPLKPLLRRFSYAAGSVVAAFRTRGWRLRIEVDGRVVTRGRRRVLMVGIGNGSSIGGGTPLTPDARPDDAAADVVVSFATGPLQRLRYGLLLRRGEHGSHESVVTLRGKQVTVSGGPVPVNADGELSDPVTRRTWRIRPHAWRIMAPAPGA